MRFSAYFTRVSAFHLGLSQSDKPKFEHLAQIHFRKFVNFLKILVSALYKPDLV